MDYSYLRNLAIGGLMFLAIVIPAVAITLKGI